MKRVRCSALGVMIIIAIIITLVSKDWTFHDLVEPLGEVKAEAEGNNSESKEPENKEPENKEPENKEPENKEPESKEPETKEPETKEPETKEPENKNDTEEKKD